VLVAAVPQPALQRPALPAAAVAAVTAPLRLLLAAAAPAAVAVSPRADQSLACKHKQHTSHSSSTCNSDAPGNALATIRHALQLSRQHIEFIARNISNMIPQSTISNSAVST
jgi:hypothetical protein